MIHAYCKLAYSLNCLCAFTRPGTSPQLNEWGGRGGVGGGVLLWYEASAALFIMHSNTVLIQKFSILKTKLII